ncbi:hypothetical protein [Actinomadura sp. 3N508]|uniref:hypothetical protein n=1 Tax=Actinomadura sp. 3N508 TaxID=3375153 RepID=UPI00379E2F6F
MALTTWEHDGDHWCMLVTLNDEGRYFELSVARTMTATTGRNVLMPGPTAVTVLVYHPAEEMHSVAFFNEHEEVPFEVLTQFVERVNKALATEA